MATNANAMLSPAAGGGVELSVARDMAKRAVIVAPVLLLLGFMGWGFAGVSSVAFGLGLVVVNFVLSAWLLDTAAKISVAFVMGAALFGYLLRLGLITIAVLAVKDRPWIELIPLSLTIVVTHLGLLFWEMRHVSATLAFPGLKPSQSLVKE
jgi:membrane-bound ClpP family serine protease